MKTNDDNGCGIRIKGKLSHEGRRGDKEVFVLHGFNAANGEPFRPMEILIAAGSDEVPLLMDECSKEWTCLLMPARVGP